MILIGINGRTHGVKLSSKPPNAAVISVQATGPVSGCVVDLEQYPAHGRNPDKVDL